MGLLDGTFSDDTTTSAQPDASSSPSYTGLLGPSPLQAAYGGVVPQDTINGLNRQRAIEGLLGFFAAAGRGGMPSRLPIPTGAVLGNAAAGQLEAQRDFDQRTARNLLLGPQYQALQLENQGRGINNQLALMNLRGWQGILNSGGAPGSGVAPSLLAPPPPVSGPAGTPQATPVSAATGGSAPGANAPAGSPPLLTGSGSPPLLTSSGPPPSTTLLGGPAPSSGSSVPPSPASASGPVPILDPAMLIARAQQYARFPAGIATANQLFGMAQKMMPEGTILMSDGSVALPRGADRAFLTRSLAEKGFTEGADGRFHIDPGYVAGQAQLTSAQEWAKVAPQLYEKRNEPYSLSRPGEMRVVPGQGVVAQTPVLTKSIDPNTGATSEEYRYLYNQPGNPAAAPAPSAATAPPANATSQLPAALRNPNNPPSVFNPPVSGGAPSAPAPDTSGLNAQGLPRFQTTLPPAREGAEKKLGEDFGDKDKKAYDAANVTLGSLSQMIHSIEVLNQTPGGWLNTGAGNLLRGDLAKTTNSFEQLLNIKPSFDPTQIANWESLNKNTKLMGMQVINQYFGGSREAASIINGATSAVPNSENTYLGARLVASGIEQAAQRERDLYQYKASLLGQNKSLVTAEADFNAAHPPNFYTMRGISNAIPDQAVNALLANPKALSAQFDLKYGKGLAQFVLEGGRTGLGAAGSQ